MPETLPMTGIQVPLENEDTDVPVDMKRAFLQVNTMYVLRAKNRLECESKYTDAPAGTVVTGTETDAMWRKKIGGGWSTVWQDTGWVTANTYQAWGSVSTLNPFAYRIIGLVCYWKGVLALPDSYTAESWSTIMNLPAVTLPDGGNRRITAGAATPGDFAYRVQDGQLQGWASHNGAGYSAWLSAPDAWVVEGS